MARSMWKGALAFGLVNIPIELYSATRDHRPKFRLLHAKDEAPVKYERVCQAEGKPVAWEDLVKGYEYEKGQFVVLTKDDFKTAALEKTKTIDILDFVDPKEIDERYFETPYYLQPAKGADRADELADLEDFKFPKAEGIRQPEMKMALQLIDSLASTWDAAKYTDEYKENLMKVIQAKLKGRKPRLQERETPQSADVVDLMARLRASLEGKGGAKGKKKTTRRGKHAA